MKLTNEFTVATPPDETWTALLDVPRVARALPGATIEPDAGGDAWKGMMKVRLGPITAAYAGTARLQDVDDDDRVASFHVQGREARGQGTAAATISSRLSSHGDGTRVVVETDLQVTGRQAQLGHGIMEDVAGAILREFATRLERDLRGEARAGGSPDPASEEALELSRAVYRPLLARAGLVAIGLTVGIGLGWAVGRR